MKLSLKIRMKMINKKNLKIIEFKLFNKSKVINRKMIIQIQMIANHKNLLLKRINKMILKNKLNNLIN
jgi:hypothetical protein